MKRNHFIKSLIGASAALILPISAAIYDPVLEKIKTTVNSKYKDGMTVVYMIFSKTGEFWESSRVSNSCRTQPEKTNSAHMKLYCDWKDFKEYYFYSLFEYKWIKNNDRIKKVDESIYFVA